MYIAGTVFQDFPPFTEKVEIKFNDRVNVLIGPNATGKSTVIRALQGLHEMANDEDLPLGRSPNGKFAVAVSDDWPKGWNSGEMMPIWNTIPMAAISSTRISLPTTRDPLSPGERLGHPEALEGNISHLIFGDDLGDGHFDGSQVELVGDILAKEVRKMSGTENYISAYMSFHNAMQVSFECARRICDEILFSQAPYNFITNEDEMRYNLLAEPDIRIGMSVGTIDGGLVDVYSLSAGTQSVLMWIRWIALKMLHFYNFAVDWRIRPAILLIDEIENNLHPTWQRRVIPALLEHFPGLQIFATTHSPFVVAGLKAGQVHLLNRDANGIVTASTNTEDIVGWTADEILRTMMGVDDPTDDATASAARELRQLRNEGPRDTAEAEEQRQERMQQLRRLVDRDLLAGGPMAARQELFEQQFNEALEKYRQSQGLGQDSG